MFMERRILSCPTVPEQSRNCNRSGLPRFPFEGKDDWGYARWWPCPPHKCFSGLDDPDLESTQILIALRIALKIHPAMDGRAVFCATGWSFSQLQNKEES